MENYLETLKQNNAVVVVRTMDGGACAGTILEVAVNAHNGPGCIIIKNDDGAHIIPFTAIVRVVT